MAKRKLPKRLHVSVDFASDEEYQEFVQARKDAGHKDDQSLKRENPQLDAGTHHFVVEGMKDAAWLYVAVALNGEVSRLLPPEAVT